MEKIECCRNFSTLTGQKEVLRFPHNETEVAQTLVENPVLLPKPASTFLVHRKGNDEKPFLIFTLVLREYRITKLQHFYYYYYW